MRDYLNNRQISFYLFGIILGYGFINLPKSIVENAGTGGWISILLSTIIVSIFTYIVTYLGLIFKEKNFIEYSNLLLGKTMTFIISILYFIYFFLILSFITRISCETIKLIILPKTPVWVLSFFMFISVYYSSVKGLQCIGRICELYGVIIILFIVFIHIFMFIEGEAINLKPLLGEINFLS
ncbi:spore germination protein KB [Caloramator quimbayensis]|uniref:Spore germination protein KB n=1 Tax=Caloramator quimbayensis TaxID=1147123 RepID=A0A1T4XQC9_9CLOT|nr:GerAB/ArcD/ProY family transporter [Caloramator quimbayensis]SKA91338.1 spore germination protein KB [Caloramator quimbayensis]